MNKENAQTVADLASRIRAASEEELALLERTLASDSRITIKRALEAAHKRINAEKRERARIEELYAYESKIAEGKAVIGLDEVGRGPLAGPLSVGAVVLDPDYLISGLNDSKQISERTREAIARDIQAHALAYTVQHISPGEIDAHGMSICLRKAFSCAVATIDAKIAHIEVILLDGNPLHFDSREINIIKGDTKCASIAAASIIAKVERDALMRAYAQTYPEYGFDANKGYASSGHQDAIRVHGLTPIHRVSFCSSFLQQSLF